MTFGASKAQLQAKAVDAGFAHTCAVTTAGGVRCWGANAHGQLGDGTTLTRTVPVPVRDLSGVQTVIAEDHTCALTVVGGVWCWGGNSHGELGDGTRTDQRIPVSVSGLSGRVLSIAVGLHHTCALTESGTLQCWGENAKGQLGNNATADSSAPVTVLGISSVAGVAAGGSHTCALTRAGGGVKCWGSNAHGQLGIGLIGGSRLTPVDVDGLTTGVDSVSLGHEHSCAVTRAGAAKCWGVDNHGQLGTINNCGTFPDWICPRPVQVDDLSTGVSAIAAGPDHTCARTSAGSLKCWGEGNVGQLGWGHGYSYTPVDVSGFQSGASSVTVGASHTCALTLAGDVACWGGNSNGRVGDGTKTNRSTPVSVLAGPAACVVPRLKGKTLGAVKSVLASTACSLGPIRRKYSAKVKKGRVLSQRPAPGAEVPAGTPVSLTVSKGMPRKRGG